MIKPSLTLLYNFFYNSDGKTWRFPFYWQEFPQILKSRVNQLLSPEDRYTKLEIKFKASLEERRNLVKALNEKNSLMIKKIEMVSINVVENEKLVKAIESLNMKFNISIKDLRKTNNNVNALNNQLTTEEKKKKNS
ncbi:hypothetical protein HKD37_01G000545 [Glycine soja]